MHCDHASVGAGYYGKGMRIDYVLVARALTPRVESADVLGSGNERDGFLGSDHCPLLLQLSVAEPPAAEQQTTHASKVGEVRAEREAQPAGGRDGTAAVGEAAAGETGEAAVKRGRSATG